MQQPAGSSTPRSAQVVGAASEELDDASLELLEDDDSLLLVDVSPLLDEEGSLLLEDDGSLLLDEEGSLLLDDDGSLLLDDDGSLVVDDEPEGDDPPVEATLEPVLVGASIPPSKMVDSTLVDDVLDAGVTLGVPGLVGTVTEVDVEPPIGWPGMLGNV